MGNCFVLPRRQSRCIRCWTCAAIPAFIRISDGKMCDAKVQDTLPIEAGAFYVMDRGYLDFTRLFALHGNRGNAVKTQIWCAIATYVLIAIVKKELQLDATLYTLLQILSVSVFEKTPISQAFAGVGYISEYDSPPNQLNLFDF